MDSAADDPGRARPRSSWGVLRDGTFGSYFLGKLLSNIGVWVQNIASAALVWQLTSSAFLVGMVSVAQFVPQLVITPLSGAMADRGDPRLQLLLGRAICSVGAGVLSGWVLLTPDVDAVPPAVVMVTALVVGIGFAIGGPAMQAMLPTLVRDAELGRAVALDNMTFSVGRAVGPAVGGVVAATLGYGAAFGIAALGHVVFFAVLLRLRTPGRSAAASTALSVMAGVRYLRIDPVVAALLVGVTAIGVGADPAVTLAPSLAASLGGGAELVGLFASAFGIGAFLGFFVQAGLLPFLGHPWLTPTGLLLLSASAVGLIASGTVTLTVLAFGLGGIGMTVALNGVSTMLYERVPREFIGRIMALWLVGFVGSRPLAAALNGALTDLTSVGVALATTAVLLVGAGWVCRPGVLGRPVPPAV